MIRPAGWPPMVMSNCRKEKEIGLHEKRNWHGTYIDVGVGHGCFVLLNWDQEMMDGWLVRGRGI